MGDNKTIAQKRLGELITDVLKISNEDFAKSIGRQTYEINRIKKGEKDRDLPIGMAIEIRRQYYKSHGVTIDWLYGEADELTVPVDADESITNILVALGFVFRTKRTQPSRVKYYDENHDKIVGDIWDLYIDERFHNYISEIQQLKSTRNRYCTDDEQYKKALEKIKLRYKDIIKSIPTGKSKIVEESSGDLIDSIFFADILFS